MTKDKLVSEIKRAFSKVSFPGDRPEDIAIASWHFKGEHMEGFSGKKWTEIDADFIKDRRESTLPVMTCKALRYYFPGFLLASFEDETAFFGASILYTLNPWQKDYGVAMESRITRFLECFDPLSIQQKKAICSYLLYIYENGDDHYKEHSLSALKNYWQDFK